jgi:hypothetical protein
MRTVISSLCLYFLVSMAVQADVYVKGNLHIGGSYRFGHNVPDTDVVNEWWFGKNKVTFISQGWRMEYLNNDWRFTLDREKQRILVVNLREKWFAEVLLPMNLSSYVYQGLSEYLKTYQIDGKIEKTGQKETINQKLCDVYKAYEWITLAGDHFYGRERLIRATTDISFDWQMVNELYLWIASFFNPQQTYLSELKKLKGFVQSEDDIFYHIGIPIEISFKVDEICNKKPPEDIYAIPKGFKKKDRFSTGDLFEMRGIVYIYPLH